MRYIYRKQKIDFILDLWYYFYQLHIYLMQLL